MILEVTITTRVDTSKYMNRDHALRRVRGHLDTMEGTSALLSSRFAHPRGHGLEFQITDTKEVTT